jgi:hypothetical protein
MFELTGGYSGDGCRLEGDIRMNLRIAVDSAHCYSIVNIYVPSMWIFVSINDTLHFGLH